MFNIAKETVDWAKSKSISHTHLLTIDSTNNYAKKNLTGATTQHDGLKNSVNDTAKNLNNLFSETGPTPEYKFPHLIIANHQTQGKGRGGNLWESSDKAESLTMSLIFKLNSPPQPIAAPCFGWATYKALTEVFDAAFSLKAPNDIYIENKKMGGILLESISQGTEHYLVFGLGLNIFHQPKLATAGALTDYLKTNELQENHWQHFLDSLYSLTYQASLASIEKNLSNILLNDIEKALKLYPKNKIKMLEADGSLILQDNSKINWATL